MSAVNTRLTLGEVLNPEGRIWIAGYYLSPAEVLAMREHVDDRLAASAEEDQDLDWMTDACVVKVIARGYPGGVKGFVGHGCDQLSGPHDISPEAAWVDAAIRA
jgi:hypothetical protein